jgi:histidyl-tRNA synthetase
VSTRKIAFVISEIQNNTFKLKDMSNGSQVVCTLDELIDKMQ